MQDSRINYLCAQYLAQKASAEELEEFYEILRDAKQDEGIKNTLAEGWINFETAQQMPMEKADALFNAVLQQAEGLHEAPVPVVWFNSWKRFAAAAAIIFALATAALIITRRAPQQELAKQVQTIQQDIAAPANNQAVITLANGQRIYIDSAGKGNLASQGSVTVIKLADGEIKYAGSVVFQPNSIQYNTLTNPKGSKVINMTLDDGTKVWLNAGSSLKYPVAFTGTERKVEINGEAYFEVAHNAAMPFKVSRNQTEITVLGTHFNVNAYDAEEQLKVTLLEGSVKVAVHGARQDKIQMLIPGQQAVTSSNGEIKLVKDADTEEAIAWKNGKFMFNGNDIRSVMRQLQNWYNVEVEYQGNITTEEFVGVISRSVNISQILNMLEKTKAVNFEIADKKIIVK